MTEAAPPHDHTPPSWWLDNPIRRLLQPPGGAVGRLDPRPGHRVVDLGAGPGYLAKEVLRRIGPDGRLTLVDISPDGLERFQRKHGADPQVETVVASAAAVPMLASGRADRVLLNMVLCDLEDKRGVLEETWRLLKPGGMAYLSFHSTPTADPSRPFWVTPEMWKEIGGLRAWEVLQDGGNWQGTRWFLLRRPPA